MVTPALALGLSLSLTGRYAAMGRQALAGLRVAVEEVNAAAGVKLGALRRRLCLECRDDGSEAARCADIYRWFCAERRPELLLGPYSSGLTRRAAQATEAAGRLMINHAGADDAIHSAGRRLVVGVLSPASSYFTELAGVLGRLRWLRKRVALLCAPAGFSRAVGQGAVQALSIQRGPLGKLWPSLALYRLSMPAEHPEALVPTLRRLRCTVVVSAGTFEGDVALARAVVEAGLAVSTLACVAAGVTRFKEILGEACEGIVGPSQWEESLEVVPALGLAPAEFVRRLRATAPETGCDYPAAQAYAAARLAVAAVEGAAHLGQAELRCAFNSLQTTTLFGEFAIDRESGIQIAHRMLLVQWHRGEKVIIAPQHKAELQALQLPAGWRLILGGLGQLGWRRGRGTDPDEQD